MSRILGHIHALHGERTGNRSIENVQLVLCEQVQSGDDEDPKGNEQRNDDGKAWIMARRRAFQCPACTQARLFARDLPIAAIVLVIANVAANPSS